MDSRGGPTLVQCLDPVLFTCTLTLGNGSGATYPPSLLFSYRVTTTGSFHAAFCAAVISTEKLDASRFRFHIVASFFRSNYVFFLMHHSDVGAGGARQS